MTTAAERKYEELARRMTELKEQMLALATEVHQDRAPGKKDDDARDHVDSMLTHVDVRKAAVFLKQDCERQLDLLARQMQGPGETFEASYSKMLDTPLGRSMLATLEDSQALASGGPTAGQLAEHRKSLGA
jgi:hypothetical protein